MKNFRYTLFVCLCGSLLFIPVSALASKSGCDSKQAAPQAATDETITRKVVEDPAMAAIPPAEKGKPNTEDARRVDIPPVKEDPAMAVIPGK